MGSSPSGVRIVSRTIRLVAFLSFLLIFFTDVFGAVRVRGYYRKNGTYVAPHYRSAPDGNFYNNWSTKGNVNPYTGKAGSKVTPPSGLSSPYVPTYRGTSIYRSTPSSRLNLPPKVGVPQLQGISTLYNPPKAVLRMSKSGSGKSGSVFLAPGQMKDGVEVVSIDVPTSTVVVKVGANAYNLKIKRPKRLSSSYSIDPRLREIERKRR